MKCWDHKCTAVKHFRGHKAPVLDMGLNGDCSRMVTASQDGTAKVWDVERVSCTHTLRGHRGCVPSCASPPPAPAVIARPHRWQLHLQCRIHQ